MSRISRRFWDIITCPAYVIACDLEQSFQGIITVLGCYFYDWPIHQFEVSSFICSKDRKDHL